MDAQLAPHQFSLDLGFVQDGDLHAYVERIGRDLQATSAQEAQPCTCRVLNAHHLNSYAFPGGTLGITRGLLLMLQDEAELAAVLAHQLGHLGAGHTGQRQRRRDIRPLLLASTVGASQESAWAPLIGLDEPLGGSRLLTDYRQDEEAGADQLALRYLTGAGYPAQALPAVLGRLAERARSQPGLLAAMTSRHPLDDARLRAAQAGAGRSRSTAPPLLSPSTLQARWTAQTAWLQRQRPAVEAAQRAELALLGKDLDTALQQFELAVRLAPQDYAMQVRLAQCLQALRRSRDALAHADQARSLHPREAQAHRLAATLHLSLRDPAKAWLALEQYDRLLPGDPGVIFLQGVALESLGRTRHAAEHYRTYLRVTQEGQAALYALTRLKSLGYPP